MKRFFKRLFIILVYFILFFLAGYLIYSVVKPKPSCFDSELNQGEERIDCGGPCAPCEQLIQTQPLLVLEEAFVYGGPGKYDILAKVTNPNHQFGSPDFSYEVTLVDSSGKTVAEKTGKEFVLPAETKYILEVGLETIESPAEVRIEISDTKWQEFASFEKPRLNIYNKRYNLISSGVGHSEAYGLLKNETNFDLNVIKVMIILRDSAGKPLALNTTEMRTVNAGEERDFRLVWPTSFPGEVTQVEMEAEADVYNSQNFIKKYFPEGKFQEFQ